MAVTRFSLLFPRLSRLRCHLGPKLSGLLYLLSVGVFQLSQLALNLYAAKTLSIQAYGQWSLAITLLGYANLSQLGSLNAMNLLVPYMTGQGDEEGAQTVRRVALSFTVCTAMIVGIFMVLSGLLSSSDSSIVLLAAGVLLPTTQLLAYYQIYLKSAEKFVSLSFFQMILGLIMLGGGAVAIRLYGFGGLIASQCLVSLVLVAAHSRAHRHRWSFSLDTEVVRRLIRVGLPIIAVGIGYLLLTTIDRWIIAHFYGTTVLGHYAFLTKLAMSIVLIAAPLADFIYPKMSRLYGQYGKSSAVISYFTRTWIPISGIILLFSLFFVAAIPTVISLYFPQYELYARIIPLIGVSYLVLAIAAGLGAYLNSVRLTRPYLWIQVAAIGIKAGVIFLLGHTGAGLVQMVLGQLLVYVAYLLALMMVAAYFSDHDKNTIKSY